LILAYVFFFGGDKAEEDALVSTSPDASTTESGASGAGLVIAQDFLSLLLNVKSIRLDDSIFADPAFLSLRDSSIMLIPDGTEGRPNPFAPIGSDIIAAPVAVPAPDAPVTPAPATTN